MADFKKKNRRKKTTNESLNSHWLPAYVAGRLTVLPANCKIHPHLARGRVLISGPDPDYLIITAPVIGWDILGSKGFCPQS